MENVAGSSLIQYRTSGGITDLPAGYAMPMDDGEAPARRWPLA
jgi:hypothetical protein